MDLCTIASAQFLPQAANLIQSYRHHSYNKNIYLYYFNTPPAALEPLKDVFGSQLTTIEVEEVCSHALSPRVFFYKVYALYDCINNHSDKFIYSDSANCFIRDANHIHEDLIDDALFLPYNLEELKNKYWTTRKCFKAMECESAKDEMQYWAGFQAYKRTQKNLTLVGEMLEFMKDPLIAKPETTVQYPDGKHSPCIEHRCDQSVLSLLIHKHGRHHKFDYLKNLKYGDWQTIAALDKRFKPDTTKTILSARESKFGGFRFLKKK